MAFLAEFDDTFGPEDFLRPLTWPDETTKDADIIRMYRQNRRTLHARLSQDPNKSLFNTIISPDLQKDFYRNDRMIWPVRKRIIQRAWSRFEAVALELLFPPYDEDLNPLSLNSMRFLNFDDLKARLQKQEWERQIAASRNKKNSDSR
jgi:hypothetical protein